APPSAFLPRRTGWHRCRRRQSTDLAPPSYRDRPSRGLAAPEPFRAEAGGLSMVGQPVGDRLDVPFGPREPLQLLVMLANFPVLLVDRALGVDGDETEDQRQRFVLADDPADELLVAGVRVVDPGDVLAGFVIFRLARRGNAHPGRIGRDGEIEDDV